MKFDAKTLTVLKNFAMINPSISIKEGNILKTISPSETIMAQATIDNEFKIPFAIYDIPRFLSVLSLFDDPDIIFHKMYLEINQNNNKVSYTYANPINIKSPKDNIKFPDTDFTINLTIDNFSNIMKGLSIMKLPEFVIESDGEVVHLKAMDIKNQTTDNYSISVGTSKEQFKAVFKAENIKIIPDNYIVKISKAGFALFKSQTMEYFIAVEAKASVF
jgi:hypothetical protein